MSAPARHPLPLDRWGPGRADLAPRPEDLLDEAAARAWCRKLASSHYENFPVVTALVPADLRDDFAAVYAFCRWADDLGDESGSPERASELLAWWRRELDACVASAARLDDASLAERVRHPVFVALRPTIARHALPAQPFHDLVLAFEMDQRVDRYDTWAQVVGYCRLSADPVGRLVLMLLGESRSEENFRLSDCVCTALQLTNHWQDIRRDRAERNRVYVPRDMNPIDDFERRLAATVEQGFGCDHAFLEETRRVVRSLVERTWPLFDEGRGLLERLKPTSRPIIELFIEGGERVLASIESWNCETVLHRPRLSKPVKLWLVARAWVRSRRARRRASGPPPVAAVPAVANGAPSRGALSRGAPRRGAGGAR